MSVVTDKKIPVSFVGGVTSYTADIVAYNDYYPFGSMMPGRNGNSSDYRFGFNGMEKDDEVKGVSGSSYTSHYRQYDPRLGRWLSIDPALKQFPQYTPYSSNANSPLVNADPNGNCPWCIIGAVIGASVDYGAQVAMNYAEGNEDAWTDVDLASIAISAVSGAATGGVSAFVKTTVQTGAKVIIKKVVAETVIQGAESVARKINDGKEISDITAKEVAKDIIVNKISSGVVKKIIPKSIAKTESLEKQLDRAKRVARESSKSRVEDVSKLNSKINAAELTARVKQQATEKAAKKVIKPIVKAAASTTTPDAPPTVSYPSINFNILPKSEQKDKTNVAPTR